MKEINFIDFLVHLAPGCILSIITCLPVLLILYKKELTGRLDNYEEVLHKCNKYRIRDWKLLSRSGCAPGFGHPAIWV